MKGNQVFYDSQRAVDAASNAVADRILATSATARAYYDAIRSIR